MPPTPTPTPGPSPRPCRRPARWCTLAPVAALALLGLCALPTAAQAQEQKIGFEILGFDAEAKTMLVKLDDVNTGLGLRVYDVETGQPAKKSQLVPYVRVDGVKTIKEAKKRFKITDPGIEDTIYPDKIDEKKDLSIFGLMANKERFVIAATDKKKLGKIKDVPVKVDEETKTLAKATLKTVYWTSDRKTMVAVVHQKLDTGSYSSETDEFHAVRFDPKIVKWVQPEKKKEEEKKEEKKEEEEDKGWWPF